MLKKGKCPICGQDMYDPLLSELKAKGSPIEDVAKDILNKTLDLITKDMEDGFEQKDIGVFAELFEATEAYYNIKDMIVMQLMPEEGGESHE